MGMNKDSQYRGGQQQTLPYTCFSHFCKSMFTHIYCIILLYALDFALSYWTLP